MTELVDELRAAHAAGAQVDLVVSACAFNCCSRGWHRRDYEQGLTGKLRSMTDTGVVLVSAGIGTVSYFAAVELTEIIEVRTRQS